MTGDAGTGSVVVRRARPGDAARLAEVSRAAIGTSAAGHYTPAQRAVWAARRTVEAHARWIEATVVVVAEVGGDVVGFASVALSEVGGLLPGEVDQLFVAPEAGGRGIARVLLEAVEAEAREAGLTSLVTHASWRAAPVFDRLGYSRTEVERVVLDGEEFTRVRMAKWLG